MENAALLFLWMSTLFPAPYPALPAFLRHLCDSKLALRWPQSGRSAVGRALGAAHRTFGLAKSRESLRALRLRIHWVEWGVFCGIFSAELAWKVSTGARDLSKDLPSAQGVARRQGAVCIWAPATRAVRACWPGAGRLNGGAGGNVPVFSLINDVHAAARGSCALSLALGLVENGWGDVWNRAHQAHLAGACAPTRPTLAAPWGREARAPSRGHLRGVAGQGTRVCSPGSCGATWHTRSVASSRGGTGHGRGCREEPGTAPHGSASRVGGHSRAEGQTTKAGKQGTRNRGTDQSWLAGSEWDWQWQR